MVAIATTLPTIPSAGDSSARGISLLSPLEPEGNRPLRSASRDSSSLLWRTAPTNISFSYDDAPGHREGVITRTILYKYLHQIRILARSLFTNYSGIIGTSVWETGSADFGFYFLGLCIAPKVFTKLTKPIPWELRLFRIEVLVYLCDWLIWGRARNVCLSDTKLSL